MKAPSIRTVRCAIYTRVSTEYGLDQEFNSLDAQYDAASAYIKSQAHAGWTLIRSRYDDHNRSDAARSSQLSILYSRAPAGQLPSEIQSPGTEFWMQRPEAKNPPERPLLSAETRERGKWAAGIPQKRPIFDRRWFPQIRAT